LHSIAAIVVNEDVLIRDATVARVDDVQRDTLAGGEDRHRAGHRYLIELTREFQVEE
jgi:hypothetical protein